MLEAIQIIQQGNSDNAEIMIVLGGGIFITVEKIARKIHFILQPLEHEKDTAVPSCKDSTEMELERIREELRTQMELKEQELKQVSRQAREDILGKLETVMENELNCGICSELMVFVSFFFLISPANYLF